MDHLSRLPDEMFVENIFPGLDVRDVMHLASTCKRFNSLAKDDMFWKRKLEEDYNFTPHVTARTSGWLHIYKGLWDPQIYVWGERTNGRLGLQNPEISSIGEVSSPQRLKIPGTRVVNLVAGGWSFHALDSEGNVHVWGVLNPEARAINVEDFWGASRETYSPLKLLLPSKTIAISCGKGHAAFLSSDRTIWNFLDWGRPFRLVSPLLDCSSPESTPQQVECGWTFTSALTKSGNVLVWFPRGRAMVIHHLEQMWVEFGRDQEPSVDGSSIPCVPWELHKDPVMLPPLPNLPQNSCSATDSEATLGEPQIILIGGAEYHLIALTNYGHVLKFAVNENMRSMEGTWTYLPRFSESRRVQNLLSSHSKQPVTLSTDWKITHISAHYGKFTAYSADSRSVVLSGREHITTDQDPEIPGNLQNKGVISVILGDFHQGALTSKGKLYMWGRHSKGALGLGDPEKLPLGSPGGFATEEERLAALTSGPRAWRRAPADVVEPAEVTFPSQRSPFCFSACASGWHTGALVVDLDETQEGLEK